MVQIVHARRPLARKNTHAGLTALGPDQFEGYASLFGVADGGGDTVAPGAFAASLRRRGPGAVRPIADVSWQSAALAFEGTGQVPLAPCHVGFAWSGGDLVIQWRRRDRSPSAASLRPAQSAMSEAFERYDLEILDGGVVKRSFSAVSQHSQVYTAAQQAADFPSGLPNPLTVNVHQLSAILGRGRRKQELLYVR